MTKIITIAAENAPKAVGPYSQARKAVEAEATLYVSGQLPINPATGTMPESIEEQTRQSLDNLGAILKEAGMDYSDIVKTTVLLDSIKDFAAMNAVYAEYFEGEKPARMCYEVAALPLGAKDFQVIMAILGKSTSLISERRKAISEKSILYTAGSSKE